MHGNHRNTGPASKQAAAGRGTQRSRHISFYSQRHGTTCKMCCRFHPQIVQAEFRTQTDERLWYWLWEDTDAWLSLTASVRHFTPILGKSDALSYQHGNKTMPHHRHLKLVPAREYLSIYWCSRTTLHPTINYLNNHDSNPLNYVFNSTNKSQ